MLDLQRDVRGEGGMEAEVVVTEIVERDQGVEPITALSNEITDDEMGR